MMATTIYRYVARTVEGDLVRGTIDATGPDAVWDALRTRALYVTAIDRESRVARSVARGLQIGSVKRQALLAFFRAFATLIRAGVSIQHALSVTIERAGDERLRESLRSVQADVENGMPLSDAMARRPRTFAPLYVAMIRSGEAGGILDEVLERLASLVERDAALRKKVRAALAYPAVVSVAALGLVIFLIARIVPMFAEMFVSFHVELPFTTRLLLAVGALLSQPAPWVASTLTAGVAAVGLRLVATSSRAAGAFFERLRLGVPIVGALVQKTITARIARTLATLLRSGVELVTAIEAVRPVCGSRLFAGALAAVVRALRDGESLSAPLAHAGLFDPLFLALVRVGEETGLVDEMLLKIADYFEDDVEATIATLGAVIEPLLIVVLGGVVGFIVFSIFIPLYALIGNLSK
jgi:type IV pilus assembly protein PilC